jgi:hypothetical protein
MKDTIKCNGPRAEVILAKVVIKDITGAFFERVIDAKNTLSLNWDPEVPLEDSVIAHYYETRKKSYCDDDPRSEGAKYIKDKWCTQVSQLGQWHPLDPLEVELMHKAANQPVGKAVGANRTEPKGLTPMLRKLPDCKTDPT